MRKALVNDVVHSFCFAVRQGAIFANWPLTILGQRPTWIEQTAQTAPKPTCLIPFIAYAMSAPSANLKAMTHISYLYSWFYTWTDLEQEYAASLMEKYYGIERCTCTAFRDDTRSVIPGNKQQELSSSTKLPEHDKLLNSERITFLPQKIPANQSKSGEWIVW